MSLPECVSLTLIFHNLGKFDDDNISMYQLIQEIIFRLYNMVKKEDFTEKELEKITPTSPYEHNRVMHHISGTICLGLRGIGILEMSDLYKRIARNNSLYKLCILYCKNELPLLQLFASQPRNMISISDVNSLVEERYKDCHVEDAAKIILHAMINHILRLFPYEEWDNPELMSFYSSDEYVTSKPYKQRVAMIVIALVIYAVSNVTLEEIIFNIQYNGYIDFSRYLDTEMPPRIEEY